MNRPGMGANVSLEYTETATSIVSDAAHVLSDAVTVISSWRVNNVNKRNRKRGEAEKEGNYR
jgi:hypothetical protein